MIIDLAGALPHLPGIHRFLLQQENALQQGRSVLGVLARSGYAERLRHLCYEAVRTLRLDVESVDISETTDGAPLNVLNEALHLGLELETSYDPLRALMTSNLPQVTVLHGLELLSPIERGNWLAFIVDWAATASAVASASGRLPPALWGIWVPEIGEEIPAEDVWLRVQWWWAAPSDLDVRLLCRLHDGSDHPELSPRAAWREAILPGLSGNDLSLAEHLWDVVDQPLDIIIEALKDFAEQQHWTPTKLEQWGVGDFLQQTAGPRRFRLRPVHRERQLWLRGLLQQTPEYGLQVSPAALAILGEHRQLEHLLWRGEASLLLPLIDELRLSICEGLTHKYGPDWTLQWARPLSDEACQAARENPLSVEWGHLKEVIRKCPYPEEASRFELVSRAWYLRNELAHYRPVRFADYEFLVNRIK